MVKQKKQETPLNMCKIYSELLYFVYFDENPVLVAKQEEFEELCPETIQNLLIANLAFGDVEPNNIGIKRRQGRFGLQHVHVVQFSQISDSSVLLLKRLRSLNHPNLLKTFYLVESTSKM